ncbi:Cof-type HAD-IIB family hydrolase [Flavobacterium sp.]|uniref:Cof-type HAD-IIB family hydrolase n=1 Tax=Flavobacterium sp. TaxID=239 RepID=UPI003F69C72C
MPYKMLVLDMDDTLLTDNHTLSAKNKELILKVQERGVHVILASGRPTTAMTAFAKELKMDDYNSYMISFNGAVVSRVSDGTILFKQTLSKDQIHALYDFSVNSKTDIITYLNDAIVSETDSEYIEIEKHITGMPHRKVASFKDAVTTDAVKCILLEEPSYLKQVEQALKVAKPHLSVTMSKPFFLEVAQQGIDKAASVRWVAHELNIHPSEIIAVGNAGNDLSMIQFAGLGVWVANVSPELRHHADVVVASNNEDGVAEVIERFILGVG